MKVASIYKHVILGENKTVIGCSHAGVVVAVDITYVNINNILELIE